MSLLTCPDCLNQFSDTLSKCPKCSRVITADDRAASARASNAVAIGCLAMAALVSAGVAYYALRPRRAEEVAAERLDRRLRDVYHNCQAKVSERLSSPSSAKFPLFSGGDVNARQVNDSTYSVMAWVDAQNAFGATVRSSFLCEVVYGSKGWRLSSLNLSGR